LRMERFHEKKKRITGGNYEEKGKEELQRGLGWGGLGHLKVKVKTYSEKKGGVVRSQVLKNSLGEEARMGAS